MKTIKCFFFVILLMSLIFCSDKNIANFNVNDIPKEVVNSSELVFSDDITYHYVITYDNHDYHFAKDDTNKNGYVLTHIYYLNYMNDFIDYVLVIILLGLILITFIWYILIRRFKATIKNGRYY